MAFNPKDVRELSKKDWQKAWVETARYIKTESKADYSQGKGNIHPVQDLVQKSRQAFLKLGFSETENPLFITEEDVYKQYGPEAPVILDRVYYLAGLPRPDIGLSEKKIEELRKISRGMNIDELKKIFREYREGVVEGDNMMEELSRRIGLTTEESSKVIDLFPEFKNITPVASKLTLRSHMTGAWFPTLSALKDSKMPLKLFSVGLRFRREQKVDATHLRAHYGGSMVIMDDEISIEAGKKITEKIMNELGFKDIRYVQKEATSNYYAPGTEYEVFSGEIEIADIGMYSPIALANYDIPYNVFNLGFGLERMLMVKNKASDVRELLYPQFHQVKELSDREIAERITVERKPETAEGKKIVDAIKKTSLQYGMEKSPCSHIAYDGTLAGNKIKIFVIEKEPNSFLLGPAALNDVYVHEGGVYGLPKDTSKLKHDVSNVLKGGIKLEINFLDAIANYFAAEVESQVKEGKREGFIQIKMAKSASDVNILVEDDARRFILSKNRQISIKGPVFTAVEYSVL